MEQNTKTWMFWCSPQGWVYGVLRHPPPLEGGPHGDKQRVPPYPSVGTGQHIIFNRARRVVIRAG